MRCLEDSLCRYIGQTITIFTVSGGISGAGFTGVLAHVGNGCIKMITSIGAAPACAIGSECGGWGGHGGHYRSALRPGPRGREERRCERREREREREFECEGGRLERNWLGSVTEIPIDKIASFTHHAI